VLPWAKDCDWAGPKGGPVAIEGGDLVLPGWYLRTRSVYSKPVTIEMDIKLEDRKANDGCVWIDLWPVGLPSDVEPARFFSVSVGYAEDGTWGVTVAERLQRWPLKELTVLKRQPIQSSIGKWHHLELDCLGDSTRIALDEATYELKSPAPYDRFQITLRGWQPTNRWHVRNFVVR
jgi:hypothetical protein